MKITIQLEYDLNDDEIWIIEEYFGSDPFRQLNIISHMISMKKLGDKNFGTQAIRSLKEKNIIYQDPIGNIHLTESGREISKILPMILRDSKIDDILK